MEKIRLGNDDFILFIRKNQKNRGKASETKNNHLGRRIWKFIEEKNLGTKVSEESIPCKWDPKGCDDEGLGLPKRATQFDIDICMLPKLYDFLRELSQE